MDFEGRIPSIPRGKRRQYIAAVLWLTALSALPWAVRVSAQDEAQADPAQTPGSLALEGSQFGGWMSETGKQSGFDEILEFRGGQFVARCCMKFGFAPAPYRVERKGDELHFSATTESPTHGMMQWRGTVTDGRARASVHWRRRMWLLTHENDFTFDGDVGDARKCR